MSQPSLSLPLEVVEQILRCALEPVSSHTVGSTPELSPPRSTSHLLLVSRGVRRICLPLFWRAVTVAQPSDWVALFGRDTGLLADTKAGRQKWEWVGQVYVLVEAAVPVKLDSTRDDTPFAGLSFPTGKQLPRLFFQPCPETSRPWLEVRLKEENDRHMRQLLPLLGRLADPAPPLVADQHNHASLPSEVTRDGSIQVRNVVDSERKTTFETQRSAVFQQFIRSTKPLNLVVPVSYWQSQLIGTNRSMLKIRPATVDGSKIDWIVDNKQLDHHGSWSMLWAEAHELFNDFDARCWIHGSAPPRDGQLERWIIKRSSRPGRGWRSTWAWKREDNSEFTVTLPREV